GVPVGDAAADRGDEVADGTVGASFHPLRRQLGEPALDEIQPGTVGRCEVEREARVANEPTLNRRRLVGRGVIEHDMHVEVSRHRAIDQVEEAAELLGPMPRRHLRKNLAGSDIEGGVEVGRAVADVVVDRKSTRLNSSHQIISYAVFCLKKKIKKSSGI